jgi:hypothetical protein
MINSATSTASPSAAAVDERVASVHLSAAVQERPQYALLGAAAELLFFAVTALDFSACGQGWPRRAGGHVSDGSHGITKSECPESLGELRSPQRPAYCLPSRVLPRWSAGSFADRCGRRCREAIYDYQHRFLGPEHRNQPAPEAEARQLPRADHRYLVGRWAVPQPNATEQYPGPRWRRVETFGSLSRSAEGFSPASLRERSAAPRRDLSRRGSPPASPRRHGRRAGGTRIPRSMLGGQLAIARPR